MEISPLVLEGEHVRLEPFAEHHVTAMWRAARDPAIWTWMPYRVASEEDVRRLLARADAGLAQGVTLAFAQVWRATGEVCGSTSYLAIDAANRRLEIGATWLAPAFQRSAANTEAKLLLLGHAFETLGCNRVEFKTDVRNTRSRAAIQRLGAREEGILRHHMVRPDGSLRDSVYYSILGGEWPAVRSGLQGRLAAH
jgi:RimJ/RimL family protein N-acetyltransferase